MQKLPTVEPASANRRRSRSAFRDGTAGVPAVLLVGLVTMIEEGTCEPRGQRAHTGLSYSAFALFGFLGALEGNWVVWSSRDRINVDFLMSESLPGVAEWDLSPAVKSYDAIPFWDLCT